MSYADTAASTYCLCLAVPAGDVVITCKRNSATWPSSPTFTPFLTAVAGKSGCTNSSSLSTVYTVNVKPNPKVSVKTNIKDCAKGNSMIIDFTVSDLGGYTPTITVNSSLEAVTCVVVDTGESC